MHATIKPSQPAQITCISPAKKPQKFFPPNHISPSNSCLHLPFYGLDFPIPDRRMPGQQLKPVAGLLLLLNFCMYVIILGIGGWAMNRAIDHGFIIGPGLDLPAHFSPISFPMGNAATGFFVTFAMIAGVVGVAAAISGLNHLRYWNADSLSAAASAATISWTLTCLAMGFACKEIELHVRNSRLRTMEAFIIILSATQLFYIAAIHGAASTRRT